MLQRAQRPTISVLSITNRKVDVAVKRIEPSSEQVSDIRESASAAARPEAVKPVITRVTKAILAKPH